jgi:hypothetical protein
VTVAVASPRNQIECRQAVRLEAFCDIRRDETRWGVYPTVYQLAACYQDLGPALAAGARLLGVGGEENNRLGVCRENDRLKADA